MLDTLKEFLKTLSNVVWMILSWCWMAISLLLLPFPLNLAVAFLPLYVGIARYWNEVLRIARLGFAYDRVREIPEEQMQRAFDDLEKERKKDKSL
jgi:uncharacterized membrane protein YccF (DUF307 family)